jgi:hypothetical protein
MIHQQKSDISELEKSKLDVLLKEYELTNGVIEKFVGSQFLYTQGALALLGGYILFLVEGVRLIDQSVPYANSTKLYIQFLPFLALIILSGILYQYQRTIVLQGYKQYLEFAINKIVGQNLISYGHIGMKKMLQKNPIALMNTIIYALIYITSCAFAYYKPAKTDEPRWLGYHIMAFVLFALIAIISTSGNIKKVKKMAMAFNESEEMLTS